MLLLTLWLALQEADVAGLDSDALEVREKAEAALRKAGDKAVPALAAATSGTGEGALRARALLERLALERQARIQALPKAGLSFSFKFQGRLAKGDGGEEAAVTAEGECSAAPGNRLLVRVAATSASGVSERRIVSDGTRMRIDYGDGRQETHATPSRLTENLGRCLSTTGLPARLWLLPRYGVVVREGKPMGCHFTTLMGPPGNTAFTLTGATLRPAPEGIELAFTATKDAEEVASVVIQYEAATGAIRQRSLRMPFFDGLTWEGTETLSSWKEGALKVEDFVLPPEKRD